MKQKPIARDIEAVSYPKEDGKQTFWQSFKVSHMLVVEEDTLETEIGCSHEVCGGEVEKEIFVNIHSDKT